jgi:hypothetical protein
MAGVAVGAKGLNQSSEGDSVRGELKVGAEMAVGIASLAMWDGIHD